jgi:ketosteroid isomerase-like protein
MAMDRDYTDKLLRAVSPAAPKAISDPQAVLHAAYTAVIQGDFDAFRDAVTEDVELYICGFSPMDGNWRGRREVVEATRKNFDLVAGQQPEVEAMISQGDYVAVLLRESGTLKSTGQPYRLRGVQWFTFAHGKIKRIDEILTPVKA